MVDFSATDAAFTGFRIVREHPRAVLVWAIVQTIVSLVLGAYVVVTAGPALMSLQARGFATGDPTLAMATISRLLPTYLALLVFALVFYPVIYAAMARAVLRPEESRFGYLRFGRDELRQLGLMLQVLLLGFIFYAMSVLILTVVIVVGGFAGGATTGNSSGGATAIGVGVGVIALIVFIGFWTVIAVRLSLASPLTFATERVSLFGSWGLTRGRFWPIFGAYVLTLALAAVVYMLGQSVIVAVVAIAGGGMGGLEALVHPDLGSLQAFLAPTRLVQIVFSSILMALVWPVVLTPPATIYRSLASAARTGLPMRG
jgi:hypothetical protein